jgi:hypothetical protein
LTNCVNRELLPNLRLWKQRYKSTHGSLLQRAIAAEKRAEELDRERRDLLASHGPEGSCHAKRIELVKRAEEAERTIQNVYSKHIADLEREVERKTTALLRIAGNAVEGSYIRDTAEAALREGGGEMKKHTKLCRSMLECSGVIYDGWLAMGCDCACHQTEGKPNASR